jgi:hypothetical protein
MEMEGSQIDSVLQTCLDEIASGQETLDSAIRKHPDLEADLRRELEAAAWFHSLRQSLEVRPDFMRRSSRHLYAQIRKENPHKPFFKRKVALNRWERKPAVQVALAVLLVLALLANTNSLAAAAQASGPVLHTQDLAGERAPGPGTLANAGGRALRSAGPATPARIDRAGPGGRS